LALELFEFCWGCQAHANLPLVHSLRSTLNQGPFPPRSLPASRVLWAPPTPALATPCGVLGLHPARTGLPCCAPHRLHTCRAQISRWTARRGRLLLPGTSAFPAFGTGRHPRHPSRNLLGLHSRCGLRTR